MENKFSKHYSSTSRGAYEVAKGLTIEEIKAISKDRFLRVIVFSSLTKANFIHLEKYIFSKKPKVWLSKTSGHYMPDPMDLNFLRFLPSLKRLRICSATRLTDPASINLANGLEALSFYNVDSEVVGMLKKIAPDLKSLSIESRLSKKPLNIDFVSRFKKLQDLHIEGPCKGVEEIGKLQHLQKLVLRSVSIANLDFLKDLNKLWSVDLKLGSIKDFRALSKVPNLKYLEMWMVKGVSDISFISEMKELQNLHLESLINISDFPSFKKLTKLRRIRLMNMKGLKQFHKLKSAPALQDFMFTDIHELPPEDLLPVLQNPRLKNLYVYFPSNKKNIAFKALAKKYGKQASRMGDFVYK
jgi:hypothetical protein